MVLLLKDVWFWMCLAVTAVIFSCIIWRSPTAPVQKWRRVCMILGLVVGCSVVYVLPPSRHNPQPITPEWEIRLVIAVALLISGAVIYRIGDHK
jgi:predicted membrane channel-forming protein YqfA (hemolysin III family)